MIYKLIIGGLVGFLASRIMGGKKKNLLVYILLGIAGAFVGDFLLGLLANVGGMFWDIIVSLAGACVVIWLVRALGL